MNAPNAKSNEKSNEKRVLDALAAGRVGEDLPAPPADLAERIKQDVPPRLELAPELEAERGRSLAPLSDRRVWLAAASLVVALGAGLVAVRVLDETEDPLAVPAFERTAELARPVSTPEEESASDATPDAEADQLAPLGYVSETRQSDDGDAAGRRNEVAAPAPPASMPSARLRAQDRAAAEKMELGRDAGEPSHAPESAGKPQGRAEETITVTGESPLLDERKIAKGTIVSQHELEEVPSARDPWAVVTQTPGVLSDRINVGGNESGQETVFTAPGTTADENSFAVDGVVITDMAAVGSSPTSYDFEQFEEIQVASKEQPARAKAKKLAEPGPVAPPPVPPSTGGTAEPNDQPYGDVFFRGYGTNPFIDSEDDPLSTFGLDVDTGSWGVVQRYLRDGNRPPREAVRVEELVNAFDYGDPAPERGDFRIVAEGAQTPFAGRSDNPRYRLVRFGLKAREVDASARKPAVLTFVIDVSGSMAREDRLGLVKKALYLLLDQLREDDQVALVIYGSRGQVVLDHTSDLELIRSAIGRLVSEGSTNAEEGLVIAYQSARRAYREGAINRVILCSDGVANVGRTGPDSILERIGAEARGGIELTTVGFGMGNYNDVLMEQLADRGDGAYAYVDDLDEARRVFVENLTGTLQTVARDSKVQVEVDPEVLSRYRLLGYENRDVPDERFRDDTVDAGEVGAGHTVTALYEVKLAEGIDPESRRDRSRTAMTLHLRWKSVESGEVEEISRQVTVGELAGAWNEAPRSLQLASVVAELAEILKGTYWAKEADLDALFRRAQKVSAGFPGDLEVAELVTTIGRAARLEGVNGQE